MGLFVLRMTGYSMAMVAGMISACIPTPGSESEEASETKSAIHRSENAIPNQYIVVFRDDFAGQSSNISTRAQQITQAHGGRVLRSFGRALNGFVAEIEDPSAVRALATNPTIAFIEEDALVSIHNRPLKTERKSESAASSKSQSGNPYDASTHKGADVHVYIIDTGIRASHEAFTGRVGNGFDFVDNDSDPSDCNGHGTQVAGMAIGAAYGMARAAMVHGVRVLDCNGSAYTSDIIAGVDWVTHHHRAPAVANLSFDGAVSPALDMAVKKSIAAGVTYVRTPDGALTYGWPRERLTEVAAIHPRQP